MKLHRLNVMRLQYVESGQFIIRFLTDFENTTLDATQDSEFDALYQSLLLQSPIYDRALMQIRARAESEQLLLLDAIRDKKIATFRTALNVFTHSDIPSEKAAYALMMTAVRTYKGIEHMNFEAESLAVNNFIAELRTPKFANSMTTLGLNGHLNALETANSDFKDLFNTRSTAINTTEVFDTKALRKAILDTYKELAEYVHVMAKRKNTAYYIELLTILNTGRRYYSDILARRGGNSGTAA